MFMRSTYVSLLAGVFLLGSLAACQQKGINDDVTTKYDQNDADIQTYVAKNNLKGALLTSGLYFLRTDSVPGAKKPATGEEVEFTYKSYNLNTGTFVDSSSSASPVYYPFGINSILAGLEQGLAMMGEGEKATLLIPSYLGYNDRAIGTTLPAYSAVRFDVNLKKSRTEAQQIDDYISRKKLTVTENAASGLRIIKTLANPAGQSALTGQTMVLKYKGKTLRAVTAFDSTGTGTFDAVVGQGRFVPGFDEALTKLKVGEKATIIFPSALGYGSQGRISNNVYIISPYAPLLFELEAVSIK